MARFNRTFMISLLACAVPGALVAVIATLGAFFSWGGLSFGNPTYYLTLAVAAWCPASKWVVWRLWQREVTVCPACGPVRAIASHLTLPVEVERATCEAC